MSEITVRNKTIGRGMPRIAVPIVAKTEQAILAEAERIAASPAEIAEWRVDFYEAMRDGDAVRSLLKKLRAVLQNTLLLYTCRTTDEGGEAVCTPEEYREILLPAIESADLIDVELQKGEGFFREITACVHEHHGAVVASYHNFQQTPDADFLEKKYLRMHEMGADILKIAVMPQCREDVTRMMAVSQKISRQTGAPMLAISMGELGAETRFLGEKIGSCITFGTLGHSSAPGQLACEELLKRLEAVHCELCAVQN